MPKFAWAVLNQSTLEYVITSDEAYPSMESARRDLQAWLISEADGAVEATDAGLLDDAAQRLNHAEYAHVAGTYDWVAETFVIEDDEEQPDHDTRPREASVASGEEPCWRCGSSAAGQPTGSDGVTTCPDCGEVREEEGDSVEYHCSEHGDTEIVSQLTASGFTGAPIYVATLGCGCQLIDDSADNIDAVK